MIPRGLRLALIVAAGALCTGCGGYDCVDHNCADLTGDPTLSGKTVSICHHPQGSCQGCMGWKVVDSNGTTISDCEDSEAGNCEPFMTQDATNFCALGHTVACGKGGSPCTTSGDCCAGSFCSDNVCG